MIKRAVHIFLKIHIEAIRYIFFCVQNQFLSVARYVHVSKYYNDYPNYVLCSANGVTEDCIVVVGGDVDPWTGGDSQFYPCVAAAAPTLKLINPKCKDVPNRLI